MNIDVLKNQDEALFSRLEAANSLTVLKNKPSLIKSVLILHRNQLLTDDVLDALMLCHDFSSHVYKALVRIEACCPLTKEVVDGLFLVTTRKHIVAFAELFDYLARLNQLNDTVINTFCAKRAPWRAVEGFARVEALGLFSRDSQELNDIFTYMFNTVTDNCLPVLDAAKELCVLEKMGLNTADNRRLMKACPVMSSDRLRVLSELHKARIDVSTAVFKNMMQSKNMEAMHLIRDGILAPVESGNEKLSSLAQQLPKSERRAWRTARNSIKKHAEEAVLEEA